MKIESGENVVRSSLKVSVREEEEEEEEGRKSSWSLTVPRVVTRDGHLVCRPDTTWLHLKTRDVMEPLSSSFNLSISLTTETESRTAQAFNLTVGLESNPEWEKIQDTR